MLEAIGNKFLGKAAKAVEHVVNEIYYRRAIDLRLSRDHYPILQFIANAR